jgi:hypothetical protein
MQMIFGCFYSILLALYASSCCLLLDDSRATLHPTHFYPMLTLQINLSAEPLL